MKIFYNFFSKTYVMVQLYYMRYLKKFQVWDKSFCQKFISYKLHSSISKVAGVTFPSLSTTLSVNDSPTRLSSE